jgi:hypothetical protein
MISMQESLYFFLKIEKNVDNPTTLESTETIKDNFGILISVFFCLFYFALKIQILYYYFSYKFLRPTIEQQCLDNHADK